MLGLITFLPASRVFWWGEIIVLQTPCLLRNFSPQAFWCVESWNSLFLTGQPPAFIKKLDIFHSQLHMELLPQGTT